ncbi:ABC transporter permease [Flavobacterium sp.]|uniref:ABC transporter permease n=1 Tax=Flavobacterium sp. TaxID=239 RepID=UPI00121272A6|nr:ABC transporter permease [Flavobacterium sp.]RZJ69189.1 MAG: ABC transporter permease [Flavobacterium sp.]
MSAISLIIKREFIAKVRNKSFIVMTFLSPFLFAGIAFLIGYLSSIQADVKKVAIHDETGLFATEFKSDKDFKYEDKSAIPVKALRDSVASGAYEGVLYIPKVADNKNLEKNIRYYSDDDPGIAFVSNIEDIIATKITETNYVNAKLDTTQIRNAKSNVEIGLSKSSGEAGLKYFNEIKIFIGCAFGYLIMMFIIIYGNMVMRSVIEEKTNRIIEIIISSVKPFQLMLGKIIGTSLAGVLQFLIWAIIGMTLLLISSVFFNVAPSSNVSPEMIAEAQNATGIQTYMNAIWTLPVGTLIFSFVVYFIGGYFLYSSFYAAIGAAVDSETDSQQFMFPIIMPLMFAVYIGVFTVINDPHGTVATTFSMIPLTSPIVMLMRIPFGVPWWQIALSMGILFATFFGVVWFAAKIYRIGILMYGKKPTWKEMFKWVRYSE